MVSFPVGEKPLVCMLTIAGGLFVGGGGGGALMRRSALICRWI